MNREDELARRIAQLLEDSADELPAEHRDRLQAARRQALSRHQGAEAPGWVPVWAGPFSRFTEQRVLGVRYLIPLAALVLGLVGVVYMHTGTVSSEVADIDAGLLTDELPISAYLDQGFDSWLNRSSR